ncbi:transcriptional regulator [Salmonella enterica]|nr:transcriptional regulator [Salmonella enterica]EAO4222634.1 transcriptional regulator [Salmonella enterica]EAR9568940.1 transcriptional regulator [Salmonella enterica]EAV4632256.1 transcriptional regulator [Salmonella enterica]EGB2528462.1 transcriptional regulator [Salmonella enterica]
MKTVLVYGDLWTDCCAMAAIARSHSSESVRICDSVSSLLLHLSREPEIGLILCIRPHEHVYLFYNLRHLLRNRMVLVVTDQMYYSDRCVMRYFGLTNWLERAELLSFITGKQPPEAWQRFRCPGNEVSGPSLMEEGAEISPESILLWLNLFAYRYLPSGVSGSKYALLLKLSSGCPGVWLARQEKMNPKTLSAYRRETMMRLEMKPSPISLFRGLRVLKQLQRTPFMLGKGKLTENGH